MGTKDKEITKEKDKNKERERAKQRENQGDNHKERLVLKGLDRTGFRVAPRPSNSA